MATLLHLDSSGQRESSITRRLTAFYASEWHKANPEGTTIYRNLNNTKLPFVTEELITAIYTPTEALNEQQKRLLDLPNQLMFEILEADTYVFGVPMYNFSVPAIFKAYIDAIVRPGLTFSYEGGTPKGLLKNKKVIVVTASGGNYSDGPMKNMDFVEPYLRAVFGFIGITDVTFIKAHGNDEATKAATEKIAEGAIISTLQTAAAAR